MASLPDLNIPERIFVWHIRFDLTFVDYSWIYLNFANVVSLPSTSLVVDLLNNSFELNFEY